MEEQNNTYAGLLSRFLALAVDFILFVIIFTGVTRLIKGVWIMGAYDHRWHNGLFITDPLCIIFLLVIFVYFTVGEGLYGSTLGKKLLGLKIVGREGGIPGLYKGFLRNILRLIDGLPAFNILGVYLILKNPENTRFGDIIAETRVVKTGRRAMKQKD